MTLSVGNSLKVGKRVERNVVKWFRPMRRTGEERMANNVNRRMWSIKEGEEDRNEDRERRNEGGGGDGKKVV